MDNVDAYAETGKEKETAKTIDLFNSLPAVQEMKHRLYNPKLRTPVSAHVWEALPRFLKTKKNDLLTTIDSDHVSVHLHGSMLLGIATDGETNTETTGKLNTLFPSDIDMVMFVDSTTIQNPDERNYRVLKFAMESGLEAELGRQAEGWLIPINELTDNINATCTKLSQTQELTQEDRYTLYVAAELLRSDSLFESNQGLEAHWRNMLLKELLTNPGGELAWQNIREIFSKYFVNYEDNDISSPDNTRHAGRVEKALKSIFVNREIKTSTHYRAGKFLRQKRPTIQFPEFREIKSLQKELLTHNMDL